MNSYYHKTPAIYVTSSGIKYSDLSLEDLEVEMSILQSNRDYLTLDVEFIEYHKEIIHSVLDEISKELDKADEFLLNNSNTHTHIHYDYLQEGETERKYIEWQWNSKNKKDLNNLLKEYQDLFEIPFNHLRFLHLLYGKKFLEINLENGEYKTLFNDVFSEENITNQKFYPIPKNSLEIIKKLVKAKKLEFSKNVILTTYKISITRDIAVYSEASGEDLKLLINESHDQKILKKWNSIISRNHFSPMTKDREPNYLNFTSSGVTKYQKPSFWKNWVEPALGKGPFTEDELKRMDNDRSWYLNKGWTPENGYSYDSSKCVDHNVTYMALRERRMEYFGYMFDRNVNWSVGLHEGFSASNTAGSIPMEINIVDDKKKLKKLADHFIESKIDNKLRKLELLLRGKKKEKRQFDNTGSVYVMSNKGYPNLLKIGSTYGLVEERAEALNTTGVPDDWIPEYDIKIKDAEYYEKNIHKLLVKYRYRKDREMFSLDLDKVIDYLDQLSKVSKKGTIKLTLTELKKKITL